MEHTIHIGQTTVVILCCGKGQELYEAWLEALRTHNKEEIYQAEKAYFTHRNGGEGCPVCGVGHG